MVEPLLSSQENNRQRVFLGLGSNKGGRKTFLLRALKELRPILKELACSHVYESEALLPAGAPASWNNPFLNLVISGYTKLEPLELLAQLKNIEKNLGRQNAERWSPREIDIDILLIPGLELHHERLNIPHKEISQRPFVLLPLLDLYPSFAEISPQWKAKMPFGTHRIAWRADEPQIMGILNLTPDSFSDGGSFQKERILELSQQGADIVDIGGESTRPGATPITWSEEFKRVQDAIAFAIKNNVEISLDTRHPETAERAIEMGVTWINDVSGLEKPRMIEIAKHSSCDFVFMHNLGIPADSKKVLDSKRDPVNEVYAWAKNKINELENHEISKERLIFDPGIGFGKTPEQNLILVSRMDEFAGLGVRTMVGHSRKSYFNLMTKAPAHERDVETAATSEYLARKNVNYLRVHNVALNKKVLRVFSQTQMARGVYFGAI